jgi:hypothetical protein
MFNLTKYNLQKGKLYYVIAADETMKGDAIARHWQANGFIEDDELQEIVTIPYEDVVMFLGLQNSIVKLLLKSGRICNIVDVTGKHRFKLAK